MDPKNSATTATPSRDEAVPSGSAGVVSRLRVGLLALVLFPLFALSITLGVLRASAPPPAPGNVKPGPAFSPRKTEHLLLVIVDGLRYDIGTDPKRMPHFAKAMASHTSGEVWAGQVSMTSSAVMALGTGQRGQLEQVILNLHAKPAEQNTWLENAKSQGLRLMTAGDPAWPQFYSKSLETYRTDPEGVAIDVDFNPETFANVRELLRRRPDFLVAHFVAPDHQGHAYRVTSERYAKHIHDFDQKLDALLQEVDPHWTVIVTSDHGAADSGTHGTDVAIQRRSPVYAYGPGIVQSGASGVVLDQLDLATTMPLLLGVTPAAHGTGRAIVEWLELTDAERVAIACENARRVLSYAERASGPLLAARDVLSPCQATATTGRPSQTKAAEQAATRAVRMADEVVTRTTGLGASVTHYWVLLIAGLGALCVLMLLPTRHFRLIPLGAAVVAITVALVVYVERLPGVWPNVVRGILFVAGNAVLLGLLVSPRWVARKFERFYPYSGLLPAILAATYPADTRPEVVAVTAVVGLTYAQFAGRFAPVSNEQTRGDGRKTENGRGNGRRILEQIWFFVAVLALLPIALHEGSTYSAVLSSDLGRRLLSSALAGFFVFWLAPTLKVQAKVVVLLAALTVLPIWVRQSVGWEIGRGAWLLSIVLFVYSLIRQQVAFGILSGVVGLLWISRDFEPIPLIAAVSAAFTVGSRLVERTREKLTHADGIFAWLLGFSLMFALRMGLQDGLDFGGMDWGAAAFNDRGVSATLVGVALTYKYAMGACLVAYAMGARLSPSTELKLLTGLSLCLLVRVLSLSGMFFFAGGSYWTALRVLGDLPTAVAMAFGTIVLLAVRTVMVGQASRKAQLALSSSQSASPE